MNIGSQALESMLGIIDTVKKVNRLIPSVLNNTCGH